MTKNLSLAAAGLLTLAFSAHTASGALLIDVGTHNLVGDSPTIQYIDLFVGNSDAAVGVGSLDLLLQIGDGTASTPSIVSVDLLTGTIFQSNNSGVLSQFTTPQSVYFGVAKAGGAGPLVPAETFSKIATVGISTLGFPSGLLPFDIGGFDEIFTTYYADDGSFEPYPTGIVNGFLNISPVPEPSDWAFVAAVGLLGFGVWRRHRAA